MTEPSHIMVVEDEIMVAIEIADMLEKFGFMVVGPALHVEDAIDMARTADIDAAFLDVNLGEGKTSSPVATILRDREVPFIFITAYDASQIHFRMSNEMVLTKPITDADLLITLRTVLPHLETLQD